MSRPFGDQKGFDKNGDGRLSAGEWLNWYTWKYGMNYRSCGALFWCHLIVLSP